MKGTIRIVVIIVLLGSLISLAHAIGYLWFTNSEIPRFNSTGSRWAHGDTLDGPVRSNSEIAIMQDPVFLDIVITTAPDFWHGTGYNPQFLGPRPVFRAPYYWPSLGTLNCVQQCAAQQGNLYSYIGQQYLVDFRNGAAHIYRWDRGTEFNDRNTWQVDPTADGVCLFFDGPVRVQGIVSGRVTVGSPMTIGIDDNIRYWDADSLTGITPQSSPNLLGLVSGGDIKVNNTPANGRRNSGIPNGMSGNAQTNRDSTDVVITAALYALNGSFTFEQQNDPDSGYVCDVSPDDRGTIHLFGGVIQQRRGYLHRSTRSSSGYRQVLHYDHRLNFTRPPGICQSDDNNPATTDTLDFGNVAVGATAWDTAHVYSSIPVNIGLVMTQYPFWATRPDPSYAAHFDIPVRFTPPRAERFVGSLSVSLPGNFLQIVLLGHGVHATAPPLTMDIAPNPFNSTTLLSYELREAATVRVVVHDLLGRLVQDIHLDQQQAGSHVLHLDGARWATGVYFATLHVNGSSLTRKLLLLK